jgi:FAD/FMN-containing dehydrogenase
MTTNETAIEGRVLRPGDDDYDAERLPWQRKFDPRPAVIVEATRPEDVQAALRMARDEDLPLAVQATGHGAVVASDGALLLKTTGLNGVTVDAEAGTARAGAGSPWRAVIEAAAPHGLAPLSGTSADVGVTGYTLGGGASGLSRMYGWAADSLLSADLVTADGERLQVSADEHPDLFWALRGGGGNFGVVTSLEFRLHPVTRVYGGMAVYDHAAAREILARYVEWAQDEPDESNTALVVMRMPPLPMIPEHLRGRQVLSLRSLYMGDAEAGERLLTPLLEGAGEPLMGGLQEMSFADTMTAMGPPPPPSIGEVTAELFDEVNDAVLDIVAEPDGRVTAVELRHWGGAMARPGADAGPIGHRDIPFTVAVTGLAMDPAQWPDVKAGVGAVAEQLRPHATGGAFLNFLSDPSRTRDAYNDADWARLQAIKATYDAANVLGRGHNIPSS